MSAGGLGIGGRGRSGHRGTSGGREDLVTGDGWYGRRKDWCNEDEDAVWVRDV